MGSSGETGRLGEGYRWLALLPALVLLAFGLLGAWPLLVAALDGDWLPIDHRIYHCSVLAADAGLDPYLGRYPPGCDDLRFRFVYPPAVLALFRWLSPPDLADASGLLLAMQASAFAAIALIARRLFFPALRPLVAVPLYFLSAPAALVNWAYFGNVVVILYALLFLGAAALLRDRPRVWPFLLALGAAAAFKWILLSFLLVLPFVLGRRGVGWAAMLAAAMALLYGLDWWLEPAAFAAYVANFDIHRQLVDLGGGIATLGFDLLELVGGERDLSAGAEWFARGFWAVSALGMLLLAWVAARRRLAGPGLFARRARLALGLLLGALLLPRLKDYDLYLLMPALLYLIAATGLARPVPAWLWLPAKAAAMTVWALLPYHTAVAVLALALPLWLAALWRGWVVLRPPDPAAALPPPIGRLLLSASARCSPTAAGTPPPPGRRRSESPGRGGA